VKIFRIAIPIPFENEVKQLQDQQHQQNGVWGGDAITRVDEQYTDKQIQYIEQTFPNATPIGFGDRGIAYDIGNNKILKITTDQSEIKHAKFLIQKPLETHAKVYEINENYQYIIIEKLKPLTKEEKNMYEQLFETLCSFFPIKTIDMPTFTKLFKTIHPDIQTTKQLKEMTKSFLTFINKLSLYNIDPFAVDIHALNIGFDNQNNMKILDLGYSL